MKDELLKLELDKESSVPLHQQAEELLREMIALPKYRKGALLPNEIEMSENMDISRNTLRQAINRLVYEGLLIRKKGYGTTVVPQNVMSNARNWMSFSQEMASLGIEVKNFELHVHKKVPSKRVLRFFELEIEMQLLCIERLRGNAEMPFVYFVSYFNPSVEMTVEDDLSQPLYEMLDKKYGVVVRTSREEISAKGASVEIAQKLDIAKGDPILVRRREVYDVEGIPIELNVGYYRADSFTYAIEFSPD